jgi:predicted phosphoribosyltransferase
MQGRFADRRDAGRALALALRQYAGRHDVVVLALPRGGVPVGFEVADGLDAPLDIFLVRKLGMPGHREFAMGAIASGGVRVLNEAVVRHYGVPQRAIDAIVAEEQVELERREREYREGRPLIDVANRIVVLIDDGLATGSTMRAAVEAVRQLGPARIVVAAPVAATDTCDDLRRIADEVVCATTPEPFAAVGLWYRDFSQTTDDEVRELLRLHERRVQGAAGRR